MGVSGSGKGTLRKNLEKQHIENLEYLRSYVSRPMRPGEVEGDIYHFISEEVFLEGVKNDEFLEYAHVHKTAYYGTKKAEVLRWIENGKKLVKEIEIQGLENILRDFPDFRENLTCIFLDVPDKTMRERILKRDPETPEKNIEHRLESMIWEKQKAEKLCDYIIDATQTPKKVMQEVLEIIRK
jgi:guanylate kinase